MTFTLKIDGDRWRHQLRSVADTHPGMVPVIKGNGYGVGIAGLARRSEWLGVDTVAVGGYHEVAEVLSRFPGDVLVMTPWRRSRSDTTVPDGLYSKRVIHTVSNLDDVDTLNRHAPAGTRVVVEGVTSMSRHGFDRHLLSGLVERLQRLTVVGFSIHLPMAAGNLDEADGWAGALLASKLAEHLTGPPTMYVSHLGDREIALLSERRPGLTIRPRVGTSLWLGERGALTACSTVLDRHPAERGERVGYRQRPLPVSGTVLVVSGGTAHGIGMEAPTSATSLRQRATSFAKGGLEAVGLALSPFTVAGKQRWFVEPPHMQASMLLLPSSVDAPQIGDDVGVDVRFTTSTFDRIDID